MNDVLQLLVMEMKGRKGERDVWEKVKIEGAISRQGVRYNDLTEEQKQIVKEIVFSEIHKHINAGEPQTTIEKLKKHFIEMGYKEEEIEIELKLIVNVEFERKRIHIYDFYVEAKTEHTTETIDILNACSFVAIDLISSKFSKERNEKGERLYNIYIEQKRKEEEKRRKEEEKKGLKVEVRYEVSEKVQKELAEQGKFAGKEQTAYIIVTNDTLKNATRMDKHGHAYLELRASHLNMQKKLGLGTWDYIVGNKFEKRGDEADGWVCRDVYELKYKDNYVFNKVIESEEDILQAIKECNEQKKSIEQKIKELQKKADEEYEKRRKEFIERKRKEKEEMERREREEREKIEARKKRLLEISWVKKLKDSIDIEKQRKEEIQRFLKKFELHESEITVENAVNKPFVKVSAEINLGLIGLDRYLYIHNRRFTELEETNETDIFSDFSLLIAETLAKIFDGEVVCRTDEEKVYLNVETENDTINVAIEYTDC